MDERSSPLLDVEAFRVALAFPLAIVPPASEQPGMARVWGWIDSPVNRRAAAQKAQRAARKATRRARRGKG